MSLTPLTQDELTTHWQKLLTSASANVRIVRNDDVMQEMTIERHVPTAYNNDDAKTATSVNYRRSRREKEDNWGEWISVY